MKGLVVKSTGMRYEVKVSDRRLVARLRGKFRLENKKITNPIAVGDQVEIKPNDRIGGEWVITAIDERTNYVMRQSPRRKEHTHLLASNIDQGVLIVTLRAPKTSTGFIDRFFITLEAFRIPGVIIFNKKDLYRQKEKNLYEQLRSIYEQIGYTVFLSSFLEDTSPLQPVFGNKTSLISGHSGSGKSTLINKLIPDAHQAVNEVSPFANKGVHTTTFAELFFMNEQSAVIDTSGIKELGLAEIEPGELSHYFPEMRKFLGTCKFHNCLHQHEQGCRIKEMLGKEVSEMRYKNYLGMLEKEEDR